VIGDITQNLKYGSNEESLEAIKLRAPLFFTTQGRAVTEPDYNIIMNRFPRSDSFVGFNVWSGSKEFIDATGNRSLTSNLRDVGHAHFSILNKDYSYISTVQEDDIIDFYNKSKSMMIFTRFIDPVIIKVDISTGINFISEIQIVASDVIDKVNTYIKTLEGFNTSYLESNIISFIDAIPEINYLTYEATFAASINYKGPDFFRLSNQIIPSSLSLTTAEFALFDDGAGLLRYNLIGNGPSTIGSVDYVNGIIIFDDDIPDLYGMIDIPVSFTNDNKLNMAKETFLFFENISNEILR